VKIAVFFIHRQHDEFSMAQNQQVYVLNDLPSTWRKGSHVNFSLSPEWFFSLQESALYNGDHELCQEIHGTCKEVVYHQ
jgi:hypothetical protein